MCQNGLVILKMVYAIGTKLMSMGLVGNIVLIVSTESKIIQKTASMVRLIHLQVILCKLCN